MTKSITLVCLCGIPGAGKSFYSNLLREHLSENGLHSVTISFDSPFLVSDPQHWSEDTFEQGRERAKKEIRDTIDCLKAAEPRNTACRVLIIDDIMYLKSMRREIYVIARDLNLGFCCIEVSADLATCLSRNSQRQDRARLPDDTILKIRESFESLNEERTAERFSVAVDASSESTMRSSLSSVSDAIGKASQRAKELSEEAAKRRLEKGSGGSAVYAIQQLDLQLRQLSGALIREVRECGRFAGRLSMREVGYVAAEVKTSVLGLAREAGFNEMLALPGENSLDISSSSSVCLPVDRFVQHWKAVFAEVLRKALDAKANEADTSLKRGPRTDDAGGKGKPAKKGERRPLSHLSSTVKLRLSASPSQSGKVSAPVPLDPSDNRYVTSFNADIGHPQWEEEARRAKGFFEDFGFVVFRNVFTEDECAHTRDAMWSVIEESSEGLSRQDPLTWGRYKSAGKYGLSMRGPCFHPVLVDNRQNPRLIGSLGAAAGVQGEDLLVSHDRFTIYRATVVQPTVCGEVVLGSTTQQSALFEGFRTGPRNLHLDCNPWWWSESSQDITIGLESLSYEDEQDFIRENNMAIEATGPHIQCVLNFEDNAAEDGGTIVVPRFHHCLEDWCRDNDIGCAENKNKAEISGSIHIRPEDDSRASGEASSKDGTGDPESSAGCGLRQPLPWLELSDSDPLLAFAQRVPLRAGSVLMWKQTMFHGTEPNRSGRCRLAQFLKAFPRKSVSSERLKRRSFNLNRFLPPSFHLTSPSITTTAPVTSTPKLDATLPTLTALGYRVFGLDALDSPQRQLFPQYPSSISSSVGDPSAEVQTWQSAGAKGLGLQPVEGPTVPKCIIIMGVAGCGKSTIGRMLSEDLGCIFLDADSFHPQSNVDKMASGIPLTDEDRFPWLDALRRQIRKYAFISDQESRLTSSSRENNTYNDGIKRQQEADGRVRLILACSALRRIYRERLKGDLDVGTIGFIHLEGSEETLLARLGSRQQSHFMKPGMLKSQLETLERPDESEALNLQISIEPSELVHVIREHYRI